MRILREIWVVFLIVFVLIIQGNVKGQACTTSLTSLGASWNGNIALTNLPNGGTFQNQFVVQYGVPNLPNLCARWKLSVQATGDFVSTSTGSRIPIGNVSINFDNVVSGSPTAAAMGVTGALVTLSTAETPVFTSQVPFTTNVYTAHSFDITIQGGNYLYNISNANDYTTNLIFTVRDMNNVVVKQSAPMPVTIRIQYTNANPGVVITIVSPNVSMPFSGSTDYANGVSVPKLNQLHVTGGYNAYKIYAFTTTDYLTSGSNTLSSSIVQVVASLGSSTPSGTSGITFSPTINLSSTHQAVISNPGVYYNQEAYYNFTYSISGNNSAVYAAPAGTYTSPVTYLLLAN